MAKIACIAVDWGTSNRRIWPISSDGIVLEQRRDGAGLLSIHDRRFADSLKAATADLCEDLLPDAAFILCGMVGSRRGWVEAPYLPTPFDLAELDLHLVELPALYDRRVHLVPGLQHAAPGMTDVMRGEECQLFAAIELGHRSATFLLPGTHSKWARAESGRITEFRTYMTGELYRTLMTSGTLAQVMPKAESFDVESFKLGLERSRRVSGGDLLNRLFGVRTSALFSELSPYALPSYLSGLLIGAEVSEGVKSLTEDEAVIIGDAFLSACYQIALGTVGVTASILESDLILPTGLFRLCRRGRGHR